MGVAKAGREEGFDMMGGSVIIAPSGEIVTQAHTLGGAVVSLDTRVGARVRRE